MPLQVPNYEVHLDFLVKLTSPQPSVNTTIVEDPISIYPPGLYDSFPLQKSLRCINCIKNKRFYFSLVFHTPLSGRIFARHHLTQWKNSYKMCKVHALKNSFPLRKKEKMDENLFSWMKKIACSFITENNGGPLGSSMYFSPGTQAACHLTWAAMAALMVRPGNMEELREGCCHYPTPNSTFVTFGV